MKVKKPKKDYPVTITNLLTGHTINGRLVNWSPKFRSVTIKYNGRNHRFSGNGNKSEYYHEAGDQYMVVDASVIVEFIAEWTLNYSALIFDAVEAEYAEGV